MVTILQTSLWPRADLSNHCALARISEFDDKSSIIRVFKSWVLLKITNGKQSSNATVHCERSFWKHKKKINFIKPRKTSSSKFQGYRCELNSSFQGGSLEFTLTDFCRQICPQQANKPKSIWTFFGRFVTRNEM